MNFRGDSHSNCGSLGLQREAPAWPRVAEKAGGAVGLEEASPWGDREVGVAAAEERANPLLVFQNGLPGLSAPPAAADISDPSSM